MSIMSWQPMSSKLRPLVKLESVQKMKILSWSCKLKVKTEKETKKKKQKPKTAADSVIRISL